MTLTEDEAYHGEFAAARAGRYWVVGNMGRSGRGHYPSPIAVRIKPART